MNAEFQEMSSEKDDKVSDHSDEIELVLLSEVKEDVQKCEGEIYEKQDTALETTTSPDSTNNTEARASREMLIYDRRKSLLGIYSHLRLFKSFMIEEHYDQRNYNGCTRRETIFLRRVTKNWYEFTCSWDTLMNNIELLILETNRINKHPAEDSPISMAEYEECLNMVQRVLSDLKKFSQVSFTTMTEHACYFPSFDCRFRRSCNHVQEFVQSVSRDLTMEYSNFSTCNEHLKEISISLSAIAPNGN